MPRQVDKAKIVERFLEGHDIPVIVAFYNTPQGRVEQAIREALQGEKGEKADGISPTKPKP